MTLGEHELAATAAVVGGRELEHRNYLDVRDPATGDLLASVGVSNEADVDAAVAAARASFEDGPWSRVGPSERARVLRRLSELVRSNHDSLALLETLDTGKPLSQARSDVATAARYFEYYAGVIEGFHGETIPASPQVLAYTAREPLGVTGHIVPWNYPIQIGARTVAPALAAGNCCVVKPAEEAPLTLLRLAHLALDAGLPPGALNVIPGAGATGAALAAHPGLNQLSFTGSVAVGSAVASAAAQNIVSVSLELGGKSPNIVFPDADRKRVVPAVVRSIIQNAGQTCSAGSRLLVHEAIHDQLVDEVSESLKRITLGAGRDDPDLGPLISSKQLGRVEAALASGNDGEVVTGGQRAEVPSLPNGNFLEPTLIVNASPSAGVVQEELFAPVIVVQRFADEDEAAALANGTRFGLVAAVWTADVGRSHRLAARLRCGQVFVNTYGAGGGVEFPFGGAGHSGYGREKGAEALLAFTGTKTVLVEVSGP